MLKLGPNGALLYSTFVGGSNGDMIRAITADPAGNIYLTGQTNSPDFPIKNAIQPQPPTAFASFVAKIRADGSDYVYSTYFGGSNGDSVLAIAGDTAGKTYLAGSTASGDFPVTSNALQKQFNGTFIYKTPMRRAPGVAVTRACPPRLLWCWWTLSSRRLCMRSAPAAFLRALMGLQAGMEPALWPLTRSGSIRSTLPSTWALRTETSSEAATGAPRLLASQPHRVGT